MKRLFITSVLAILVAASTSVRAQHQPEEYLGLPGDNLNLYAVMKLFQESETLEGFERNLNDENARINNLDLNGDNMVDYIMVFDYTDGDYHHIVLRVAVDHEDYQDVAVFTIQRYADGSAGVQLIGDKALYGPDYIIEPYYSDNEPGTPNPGYIGRSRNTAGITVVRTNTAGIAAWPVIRFIFRPGYIAWRSSYTWGYYPSYWSPWRPYYWHYYHGYHYHWRSHYYSCYRTWKHHRFTHYNDFYYGGIRRYSPHVRERIVQGKFKSTYSRPELMREGEALYSRTSRQHNREFHRNTSGNNIKRTTMTPTDRRFTRERTNPDQTGRPSRTGSRYYEPKNSVREAYGIRQRTPENSNSRSISRATQQQQPGAVRQGPPPSRDRSFARPAERGISVQQGRSSGPVKANEFYNRETNRRSPVVKEVRSPYPGRSATNSRVGQNPAMGNRHGSITGRSESGQTPSYRGSSSERSSSRQSSPGVRQSSSRSSRSGAAAAPGNHSQRHDSGRPSRR